MKKNVPHLVC